MLTEGRVDEKAGERIFFVGRLVQTPYYGVLC